MEPGGGTQGGVEVMVLALPTDQGQQPQPGGPPPPPAVENVEVDLIERALADTTTLTLFQQTAQHYAPPQATPHPSFAVIPRLFTRKPVETGINATIRNVARDIHYQRSMRQMVSEPDPTVQKLWELLQARSRADGGPSDALWLNYEQMLACRADIAKECPRVATLLQASTFMRMHRNDRGEVSAHTLIDIIVRQVTLWQIRLDLCSYDFIGNGELTEIELQSYIRDRIDVLPLLSTLVKEFYETYAVYASRKFCFFLDRHGNGRVRLKDLMQSDVLMEFNKLQFSDLPEDAERTNWFSVPCVSVIHDDWTALDVDESGLLDETELAKYGHGGFTKPFITRVFQYCQTYNGEIDYKVYLDIVLATMYPQRPESIRFLAHMLDVDDRGRITPQNVEFFWNGVLSHPTMLDQDLPDAESIINEVFDMVNPKSREQITIAELVNSGMGHTVCGILIDVKSFLSYDNRESPDAGQAP
eukprot:m.227375 g.227375  ORF g.227375 m.227375 type:complete len:473 (+) comp25946_c0_seq1:34-1452(+)